MRLSTPPQTCEEATTGPALGTWEPGGGRQNLSSHQGPQPPPPCDTCSLHWASCFLDPCHRSLHCVHAAGDRHPGGLDGYQKGAARAPASPHGPPSLTPALVSAVSRHLGFLRAWEPCSPSAPPAFSPGSLALAFFRERRRECVCTCEWCGGGSGECRGRARESRAGDMPNRARCGPRVLDPTELKP